MILRNGKTRENTLKIKNEPIEIVDSEISFKFKNENKVKNETTEIVDNEISFHFNVRTEDQKDPKETLNWLKTMVIIYQDLFSFDIKKEPKENYEAEVFEPKIKRKRKRKRLNW